MTFNVSFFDLETTDKCIVGNEILTGFFKTVDIRTLKVIDSLGVKMKPEKYLEDSYKIHGISKEEALSFPDKWEGFRKIISYMDKHKESVFCCHANGYLFGKSGYFDMQVITALCNYRTAVHGSELYYWFLKQKYQCISTHSIAKKVLKLDNYKQDTILKYYGIKNEKSHDAKYDVEAMIKMFFKMINNKNITKKELIKHGRYEVEEVIEEVKSGEVPQLYDLPMFADCEY